MGTAGVPVVVQRRPQGGQEGLQNRQRQHQAAEVGVVTCVLSRGAAWSCSRSPLIQILKLEMTCVCAFSMFSWSFTQLLLTAPVAEHVLPASHTLRTL